MKQYFTYFLTYLVIITVLWNILTVYSGAVDFCYGKSRLVQCDENYRIAIRDISFERNCTSRCDCTYYKQSRCAEFKMPGSWTNNRYYDAVYGLHEKFIASERVKCKHETQLFTNLAHLQYECISESHIRNFCDIIKTEGPSVHLQYGFPTFVSSKRNCICKASTTSGTLQIQAIDIRFQNGTSGKCGHNQNSYLEFDSVNQSISIKCKDEQLFGGYETIFNSTKSSMDLLLHLDGGPPIVWIAILATSGANVSVVCDIFDMDTTLSYGLTSSNSEGISLTTSANLKKTNSTTFPHSKIVNPTFTNLEVINRTTASHSEQTSTDFNIQPTDVTKYQKIAESVSGMKEKVYVETSTYAEVVNLTTTAPHTEQSSNNQNIQPTDVTKYHKIEESVSRMKDEDIDPAIIVLVLTGFLTLVLIIIGIVIGRVKYVNKRLGKKQSDYSKERKTIAKENVYIHQELETSQRPTSQSEDNTSPTIKEDVIPYSEVQKKRGSDQISDNYDHLNNKGFSTSEENNYPHNKTGIYDHCRPIVHSLDGHYDKVEVNNSGTSSNSPQQNILLYPRLNTPSKLESDAYFDEQNINPYVDEAVVNGMTSAYRLRSLSSTNDVDESIRDMMTHATSWAEEDEL